MKTLLIGLLVLTSQNILAQTFAMPFDAKACKEKAQVCSVLTKIQETSSKEVQIKSVTINENTYELTGIATAYKPLGDFISNLTKALNQNERPMITSTTSSVIEGKRMENFKLKGKIP